MWKPDLYVKCIYRYIYNHICIYTYIYTVRDRENKIVLVSLSEGTKEGSRGKENFRQ
jgi:hypothetical protein